MSTVFAIKLKWIYIYLKYNITDEFLKSKLNNILDRYIGTNELIVVNSIDNQAYKSSNLVNINQYLINELCGLLGDENVKTVLK